MSPESIKGSATPADAPVLAETSWWSDLGVDPRNNFFFSDLTRKNNNFFVFFF